jgi:hypothetical protein
MHAFFNMIYPLHNQFYVTEDRAHKTRMKECSNRAHTGWSGKLEDAAEEHVLDDGQLVHHLCKEHFDHAVVDTMPCGAPAAS